MKAAFIIVLYKSTSLERERLRKEIISLNLPDYKMYFIDNTKNNIGYAGGVNEGIRQALADGCKLFIIANPDISLKELKSKPFIQTLQEGGAHFDIWGFSMKQHNTTYYGGVVDTWRMSGALSQQKPASRFVPVGFVSGSLMVVKKKALDIMGLFDERFFMYYEDVDFCLRAKKNGLKVGLDTERMYKHYESSTEYPDKNYFLAVNRFRILHRYGSMVQKIREAIRLPLTVWEERTLVGQLFMNNSFYKNFVSLNASSLVNKILFFLLFIFLVRRLDVREYGIYTLVWAHTALLSPLLDLGTTSYGIVYAPNEPVRKVHSIVSLRVYLSIIVFLLTMLLAYLFGYTSQVILFILLTSVIIFSNAFSGSVLVISSILQKLHVPSIASIVFNLVLVCSLIVTYSIFGGFSTIFVTQCILYSVYVLANIFLIKKFIPNVSILKPDLKAWRSIISRSYVFVLIGFFAGLYYKIDIFLLNMLKGETEVGIYSAGYKFFEAFMFILASYNFAATPILARMKDQSTNIIRKVKSDVLLLTVIGVLISAGVYVLSPFLLPLFFKNEYIQAIPVLRVVIFALPCMLISSVFLNVLYIYDKTYLVVILYITQTIINGLLNVLLIPKFSFMASAYITLFSEVINVMFLSIIIVRVLRKRV